MSIIHSHVYIAFIVCDIKICTHARVFICVYIAHIHIHLGQIYLIDDALLQAKKLKK